MDYVLPCIGSAGLFKVTAPFDAVIDASVEYTVKGIRTISELESNGIDVLKTRYLDAGLTELDYTRDHEVDMHFVTLQSGYGQWYEIAARYITEFPRIDGVTYVRRNLVLRFPYIPKDTELILLAEDIEALATDFLGTPSKVDVVEVSKNVVLTNAEHLTQKALRKNQVNSKPSLLTENKRLISENQSLRNKLALLESYIIQNGL